VAGGRILVSSRNAEGCEETAREDLVGCSGEEKAKGLEKLKKTPELASLKI